MLIINTIAALMGLKNGHHLAIGEEEYNNVLENCDNDETLANAAVRFGFGIALIINIIEILALILITKAFIGFENSMIAFLLTEVITTIILVLKGFAEGMNEE
jgi:hypothetical protein